MLKQLPTRTRKLFARRKSNTRARNKFLRRLDKHHYCVTKTPTTVPASTNNPTRCVVSFNASLPDLSTALPDPPTQPIIQPKVSSPWYRPTSPAYPPVQEEEDQEVTAPFPTTAEYLTYLSFFDPEDYYSSVDEI
jgi:hypothetical protein